MAQQYQVDIVTKVTNIGAVAKLDKAIQQLAANENKVATAANKAAGSQKKFNTAASSTARTTKAAAGGVKSLGAAFALATAKITAIVGTITAFTRAMSSAFERDAAEQRLRNLTGSTEEYNAAIVASTQLSAKFGQTQTQTTKALGDTYSRLSGLGYGLKEVTQIYDGFNTIALQSGVASEEAAGAFFQLSQALGSGTLQGDELRSILERMPQLTQALTTEMGVSATQVKQLGSEGKITGDVIYSALAKAAAASGDLSGKLTTQQQAFMALSRAAEDLMVMIGRIFSPAVIAIATAFSNAMAKINLVFQYLSQTYGPQVQASMQVISEAFNKLKTAIVNAIGTENLEAFQTFLQNLPLKVIGAVVKAFGKLARFIAYGVENLAKLITKVQELSGGPMQFFAGLWAGVVEKIGGSSDRLEEFRAAQEATTAATAATVQQHSSLVEKVKTEAELKKESAAIQKELNKLVKEQQAAESQAIAAVDQKLAVANAVLDAETAINDAKLQQAQLDLSQAKTMDEKVDAINRIYEAQVTQAKLQYEATMAAVEAETAKKQAALGTQIVLQAQVRTAVELQRSAGIYNSHQEIAIQKAAEGVRIAQDQLIAQQKIAEQTERGAQARLQMSMQAAETLRSQQLQEAQQQATNNAISQGANEMGRLANEAERAAGAAAGVGAASGGGGGRRTTTSSRTTGANGVSYGTRNGAISVPHYMTNGRSGEDLRIKTPFGEVTWKEFMYYVENPTHGKHHYNADQKAQREEQKKIQYEIQHGPGTYNGGNNGARVSSGFSKSGSSGPVNVNYSGTTLNFNGDEYVQKKDVGGIIKSATNATQSRMANSATYRLNAGMS